MRWGLALIALAGCRLDGLDFHNDGTVITVTAQDEGSTLVDICEGPSELLSCNDADTYEVHLGPDMVVASEGFLSFGTQSAAFDTNSTDAVIRAFRQSDGAGSVVSLPATFELAGPTGAHSVHDSVTVTWDARHGRDMTLQAEIDCGNGEWFGAERQIADSGSVSTTLEDVADGWSGNDCRGVIVVSRKRTGRMDPLYPAGSRITATQTRSISYPLAN